MIKLVSLLSALLFVSLPCGSQAASGDQDFYKGKTIRIQGEFVLSRNINLVKEVARVLDISRVMLYNRFH